MQLTLNSIRAEGGKQLPQRMARFSQMPNTRLREFDLFHQTAGQGLVSKAQPKENLPLGFSVDGTESLGKDNKPSGQWTPFLPHPIQRPHSLPSAFWQAAGLMCVLWQPLQASVPGCKPRTATGCHFLLV